MKEYTSETGIFVVLNDEGRVIGKADLPAGTHKITDETNTEKTFDLRENGDNSHISEYLEYSPSNADLEPRTNGRELLEIIDSLSNGRRGDADSVTGRRVRDVTSVGL
ncbi:hypothetical protein ACFQGT_09580 [Natrialbaceae archaeon GCM10025810]|uniref:hypothetical protein n=1 Tax=Halovalidus salilacus TaxID=3075124 RepID=UPI003616B9C9